MAIYLINNVRARICRPFVRLCCYAAAVLAFAACSDHWDDFTPVHEEQAAPLTFTASVTPSETVTRADGSLVNRLEAYLYHTNYQVGVFGAYTGENDWNGTGTADFMFNLPMNIHASTDYRTNALTYAAAEGSPATQQDSLRYWPNQKDGSGKYHKVSFWAYYPWTAVNSNDIDVSPTQKTVGGVGGETYGITSGGGMGSIRFLMEPDAEEQSDFMISELVANASRDTHPLNGTTPTPVQLRFHHMLAQVRLYAFIRCTDKVVYAKKNGKTLIIKAYDAEGKTMTLTDGTTDYTCTGVPTNKYVDKWGMEQTLVAMKDSIPDDWPYLNGNVAVAAPKTIRWERHEDIIDVSGQRHRSTVKYSMSFNNIHTQAVFTPTYDAATGKTTFGYKDVGTLGSATVNHYIMNPYWFRFKDGEREMLNENYMYDYFEDTPAAKGERSTDNYDGIDWSEKGTNYLKYTLDENNEEHDDIVIEGVNVKGNHYNYDPSNILLVVPQVHNDNDVPHIVLEGKAPQVTYRWNGSKYEKVVSANELSGRVTINMLNMNLKWESGFIYCYAFLEDDLQPGDDKVKGPESIKTYFDPKKHTDQW